MTADGRVDPDAAALLAVLRAIVDQLPASEEHLGALDAAIGDGDHGITISRCCRIIGGRLEECEGLSPAATLQVIGTAIADGAGGAIGPLLGTGFTAAGQALDGVSPIPPDAIPLVLDAIVDALMEMGGARPGEKTLIDALAPAAAAARAAARTGASTAAILTAAADAAEAGATATASMPGGAGKAGRWGEEAVGHPDPGAVSTSLMLRVAAGTLAGRDA